jgi:putative peptide zinc metalloprotease protein
LISDAPGQGEQLLLRHKRNQKDAWISALSNPLAIRFRGIDPQRLLRWLYPRVQWFFSPWCLATCCLLVLSASLLVFAQFAHFRSRLPEMNALLSPENLVWLAIGLGTTKLLHELGHALTCQHFGAQCNEMGLMLLVLTPCPYCNVTDAWKLSSRWQRIAIAAAGIYVEVVLASVCAILWWFSQPGFFNSVCLNVMVVCSVGTVLLNGNPLLRYDGYYILSDFLETPNLWQESRARVRGLLRRCFWGVESVDSIAFQQRGGLLLLYAGCSIVYRGMVVVSVVYLLYRLLEPMGLVLVAHAITASVIMGILSVPIRSVWRTITNPVSRRQIQPKRVAMSSIVLLALGLLCFLVPLPCRITAPVMLQPFEARRVYVAVPGRLEFAVAAGDVVQSGDLLARLENTEVQRELESVRGQLLRQQMRVRNLESLRGKRGEFGAQLPAAKEILADLELRQTQLSRDLTALSLVAPVSGTVLPPPNLRPPKDGTALLRSWTGSPLDQHNLECQLERRTLLCLIGQPGRFEALLSIDQAAIQYVRKGQRVRMQLDMSPQILQGTISQISRSKSEPNARTNSQEFNGPSDEELPRRSDDASSQGHYQAHVQIDEHDVPLLIGAHGWAKIQVDAQSLSTRIYRFGAKTFKPLM